MYCYRIVYNIPLLFLIYIGNYEVVSASIFAGLISSFSCLNWKKTDFICISNGSVLLFLIFYIDFLVLFHWFLLLFFLCLTVDLTTLLVV